MNRRIGMAAVLDAAYTLGGPDEAWLARLCEVTTPIVGRSHGMIGATFEVSEDRLRYVDTADSGAPVGLLEAFRSMMLAYGPVEAAIWRRELQARSASEAMGPAFEAYPLLSRHVHAHGIRDLIGVGGCDASGGGVMLSAPMAEPTRLERAEAHDLVRLAAHFVAAFRLRRAVEQQRPDRGQVEAVFGLNGTLAHAESHVAASKPMRDLLQRAVVEIERVRRLDARTGDETVLDVWSGLVAGRWSLVDLFERDGKRFVVARRNDPVLPGPERFSERERQILWYLGAGRSNKSIAYELGLSYSAVTTVVSRMRRRLRIESTARLMAIARDVFESNGAG